jgi:hypothetical protein
MPECSSLLLLLPREIRLEIPSYVLVHDKPLQLGPKCKCETCDNLQPQILGTCHQLLVEGRQLLYSKKIFSLNGCRPAFGYTCFSEGDVDNYADLHSIGETNLRMMRKFQMQFSGCSRVLLQPTSEEAAAVFSQKTSLHLTFSDIEWTQCRVQLNCYSEAKLRAFGLYDEYKSLAVSFSRVRENPSRVEEALCMARRLTKLKNMLYESDWKCVVLKTSEAAKKLSPQLSKVYKVDPFFDPPGNRWFVICTASRRPGAELKPVELCVDFEKETVEEIAEEN